MAPKRARAAIIVAKALSGHRARRPLPGTSVRALSTALVQEGPEPDHGQLPHLRRSCRKGRATGSATISQSHIDGLMRDQICHLINPIFSKLESVEERIQDLTVKVENIRDLIHGPNQCNHEPFTQEANLEGTNAGAEGMASNQCEGKTTTYRLRFLNRIMFPTIYHDNEIKSEDNSAIRIGIFDGDNMIKSGPLSKVKVEIVALNGDFPYDDLDSWTAKQFNEHRASGRDRRKGDVLAGKCTVRLINGEIELRRIKFTEGSSKTPSGMFIIAARLCEGQLPRVRVQEAVMNPVVVQDRRNKSNRKSRRPKLEDKVHRLKKIAKGGTYCKRLEDENIFTVQDFLKTLNKDPDNLAKVLQIKKECEAWKKMVGHAQDYCLEGRSRNELKSCHFREENVVLFFDCVHCLVGAAFSGRYTACDKFDLFQRGTVDNLKGRAYDELDALCPDHEMTETDNFPVLIYQDVDPGAGPGASTMSNAMQGHYAAHQGIPAGQSLDQVESSCAIGNNGLGPSSSFPHPHSIIYQAQRTRPAGQECSSAFLNDLCQDPLGGHNFSLETTGLSDMCQHVSQEGDVLLAYQTDSNNHVPTCLDGVGFQMPFFLGNGTLDGSTSAHINMTLTPRELTTTGAPGSAQASLPRQIQAPCHPGNSAFQASASAQRCLPPTQENMPSYGSF